MKKFVFCLLLATTFYLSKKFFEWLPDSDESTYKVLHTIDFGSLVVFLFLSFMLAFVVMILVYNILLDFTLIQEEDYRLSLSVSILFFTFLFGSYSLKSLTEQQFNIVAIFIGLPFLYVIPDTFKGLVEVIKNASKSIKHKGIGDDDDNADKY